MLKKTFVLVLTLIIVYFAESSPINVATLEFDNLEMDYPDLGFERDDPIWGSTYLLKLLEDVTRRPAKDVKVSKNIAEAKESGSKKKNKSMRGALYNTRNSGDLNSFFKNEAKYDHSDNDDSDDYRKYAVTAATGAVTKGKKTRTYAKRNKITGFHRVHHKDEYKKDQEFSENDETKGTTKKVGAKALGTAVNAGGGFKIGSFKHDGHRGIRGNQGSLDAGFTEKQFNDFADSTDPRGDFSNELDM